VGLPWHDASAIALKIDTFFIFCSRPAVTSRYDEKTFIIVQRGIPLRCETWFLQFIYFFL
jgi:hypothetical protein